MLLLIPACSPSVYYPEGVIAPHRRWMPGSNPTDNGSRYWGTRCSTTRSPVDARRQSTEMTWNPATIRPHSTSTRASGRYSRDTATRSSLLAADPGPNCPGILIPLLVFLRRVTPLYNLVVGGPERGPHGGTHPKAMSRGQTHPASGPFLPRHAALKARPLEQSGPHTGTLTHRVNTTGYPW